MLRSLPASIRPPAPPPEGRRDEFAELVQAVQRGDRAATRTFLLALVPPLLRVVRRVLGPGHQDVEDVAYEAAYAVVEKLPQFRGEGTVLHFACRIAVLTAMNVRRREATQKRARRRDAGDVDALEDDGPDPEQSALASSLAPAVRGLLDTLPEELAEAFALQVILGYTVAEIADSSGVPLETVRSRLRLAKQALRRRVLRHPRLREVAREGT
jgi:RNA polymerase sigma-70 factor (ECF subfamily)